MKEKKPFAERYPNHRDEYRNECITQMMPASGWWKVYVTEDGESWIEPVAFFAKVNYEMRGVWDGGSSTWEKDEIIFANTGIGNEWTFQYMDFFNSNACTERLFYDPDFRLSRDEQQAGDEWVESRKKK